MIVDTATNSLRFTQLHSEPPKKEKPKKKKHTLLPCLILSLPYNDAWQDPPQGGGLNELVTEDGMAYTVLEV